MFDTLQKNLRAKKYAVTLVESGDAATEYLSSVVRDTTVAFGGSVTLDEIGLYDALSESNVVHWHWRVPSGSTARDELRAARNASVYVCSANAVAETGEIVNIDGNGNRVAETCLGTISTWWSGATRSFQRSPTRSNAPKLSPRPQRKRSSRRAGRPRVDRAYLTRLRDLYAAPSLAKYEIVLVDEKLGLEASCGVKKSVGGSGSAENFSFLGVGTVSRTVDDLVGRHSSACAWKLAPPACEDGTAAALASSIETEKRPSIAANAYRR